ncbi:MAG: hypothetical protein KDD40_10975, partial [Bdellovibrionales bacterium]|nr:hypothetical protein [Bdellovibrionales bacterium]
SGQVYHIAANEELSNIHIIHKILTKMSKNKDLIKYVKDRPGHDLRYSLSVEQTRRELKWENSESFDSGINKTIEWYMQNSKWLEVAIHKLQMQ